MEKKEIKDWRTRLRELYLNENDGSSFMKEIIFNWGTFSFTPNLKHRPMNYYIATQESIEDFISQELDKAREEGKLEYILSLGWQDTNNEYVKEVLEDADRIANELSKLKDNK